MTRAANGIRAAMSLPAPDRARPLLASVACEPSNQHSSRRPTRFLEGGLLRPGNRSVRLSAASDEHGPDSLYANFAWYIIS